ncbi:peptide chain release factor N(5)-glutamine methyltransferase [Candidatus Uhrbacteria bacterium]|jgi:release factor glutamine methyltransferase|nr:peptide chain release factor N(5)-glutamine methyltransferase [Candidatus Uhrbacteria bacterium]
MTILEALNWGQEQLKQTAHEKRESCEPMGDSQLLLAACLSKPTAFLFSHFEDPLSQTIIEKYQRFIARRKRHEPIAYILQTAHFYGRPFHVNPFVLIPRPETESIIDLAKEILQDTSTIIDVGTGSGAIAVTLAAEFNQPVIAIDIDPQALSVAKRNADRANVGHLLSFMHGDLLEPLAMSGIRETNQPHTLITANLPYLTQTQFKLTDPDVQTYEPKHALVGGLDGLEHYDRLFAQLAMMRDRLTKTVDIIIEIDPSQSNPLAQIIRSHFPEANAEIIVDLTKKDRFVHVSI